MNTLSVRRFDDEIEQLLIKYFEGDYFDRVEDNGKVTFFASIKKIKWLCNNQVIINLAYDKVNKEGILFFDIGFKKKVHPALVNTVNNYIKDFNDNLDYITCTNGNLAIFLDDNKRTSLIVYDYFNFDDFRSFKYDLDSDLIQLKYGNLNKEFCDIIRIIRGPNINVEIINK